MLFRSAALFVSSFSFTFACALGAAIYTHGEPWAGERLIEALVLIGS